MWRIGGELEVGRLGFGAMHLPTEPGPERKNALAVARRAVELGVTLIDTAHMYGGGANEELLAEALHPYPDDLLITTKVGMARSAAGEWDHDARPEALRDQVEQALRRLRRDHIGFLQLHRIDPSVPLADQLGALRELREEGKIGHIGLSEVTVGELDEARRITEIAGVQNRYNLLDREHEPVLAACASAGIAFLPWRPAAWGDSGAHAEVASVAAELGATATQVSLAWLLGHSPVILPIPGTADAAHPEENTAAARLRLPAGHRARLDRLAAPAWPGGRSAPQIGQHRQDPPVGVTVHRQAEALQDAADVLVHSGHRDVQGPGDGRVGPALGHQRQHLPFPGRETAQRVLPAPQQLPYHLRVQHRAAARHPDHGVREVGDRRHPVLQQVADAALVAEVEQMGGVGLLQVLAEDEDRQVRVVAAERDGGAQAVVTLARRHADVGEDEVGTVLAGRREERVRVPHRRAHLVAEAGQHAHQALPHQRRVLGDHDLQ